ncbi:LRIF1 factor, partial [Alectura lathami]|nr:LRIF1 factor [Alectura lathami]
SIAGCVYRIVQTTGPDGKNLLKLLPVSKPSGSAVQVVQSSAMSSNPKVNIPSPVHLTFQTQLGTATPPSVKIPVFQSPNPGEILLARTLDKQEGVRAGPDKDSLPPQPAVAVPSGCAAAGRPALQNAAVTSSSSPRHAADTGSSPVKPAVLPSGHHLQIPADAEVKSVPASLLPPIVQQKILAAASVLGRADRAKMPTVIYVSPVNTVKTVLPRGLQAVCPQPAEGVSGSLASTAAQKANGSAADGQRAPVKWVVRDNAQLAAPCLIPVKSSNNVASRILKTLLDAKNVEVNAASILPLSSGGAGRGQGKITPIKDDALVMYSGKVFLLTKRGSDVLSAQVDIQASSSSDASLKKEAPKLLDSADVSKINSKVVNLLLAKSKAAALPQKEPKTCPSSQVPAAAGVRSDSKPAPAALVTPSAEEQSAAVSRGKSSPFTESVSSGASPAAALGTREGVCPDGRDVTRTPRAASAAVPQSKQECASRDDGQKVQPEKMNSLGKANQIRHQEKPCWKQYLQLRKKFGLYKEERVYLKRIPLVTSCEKPDKRVCSRSSLERKNGPCSPSPSAVAVTNQHQEGVKEEKVIVDLEEDLSTKRKLKSSPQPDSSKRRRTSGKSAAGSSTEGSGPGSVAPNSSASPPSPQQNASTDPAASPAGRDPEQEPCSQHGDALHSDIPVLVSCEDHPLAFGGSFRDDAFLLAPPDLEETIRDEKIRRLKLLLREREAALEEMRRK